MKKFTVAILPLLLSAYVWTGSKPKRTEPNPVEYTLTIHVSACHLVIFSLGMLQVLDVLIDRKKYELQSNSNTGVLALGDYKAKLVQDLHKTSYESSQTYEFLFPDMKVRKFSVSGLTE
jgi:hypothetical protein